MGLILDTNVLIRAERARGTVNFDTWAEYGEAFISAITASELLVGVHKADSPARRMKRAAFVEGLLQAIPVLDFDLATARVHAELFAALPPRITVGAHDLVIGATALRHGFPVLTANIADFARMPGVKVLGLESPP